MDQSPQITPKTKRHYTQRKPSKINPTKVNELLDSGLNASDIAKHQGVHTSTITRYIERSTPENQEFKRVVKIINENRVDELAFGHAMAGKVKQKVFAWWLTMPKEQFEAISEQVKTAIVNCANASGGTDYDKMRVELGLSTQNISFMGTYQETVTILQKIEAELHGSVDKSESEDVHNAENGVSP